MSVRARMSVQGSCNLTWARVRILIVVLILIVVQFGYGGVDPLVAQLTR